MRIHSIAITLTPRPYVCQRRAVNVPGGDIPSEVDTLEQRVVAEDTIALALFMLSPLRTVVIRPGRPCPGALLPDIQSVWPVLSALPPLALASSSWYPLFAAGPVSPALRCPLLSSTTSYETSRCLASLLDHCHPHIASRTPASPADPSNAAFNDIQHVLPDTQPIPRPASAAHTKHV